MVPDDCSIPPSRRNDFSPRTLANNYPSTAPVAVAPPAGAQMATFPTARIVASTANSSNKNKFCSNCGASLNVGNKFCVNCKARIKKKKRENNDMYW